MDQRELVEITFRLPLTALGQLSSLLEAAGQARTQEPAESGQGASFDEKQFETIRSGEPELYRSREAAMGELEQSSNREEAASDPELPEARAAKPEEPGLPESRWTERIAPVFPEETVRPSREIEPGTSIRQERDVSVQRLVQGTAEAVRTTETVEQTAAGITPRALSALWERDARRYDGGFALK